MPARRHVWIATACVVGLGLLAELGEYLLGAPEPLVELFSLSYEANLPTWYATVLLFSCAVALAGVARLATRDRARWWVLAGAFLYISLDEAIEIHEHASFFDTSGVLYFSWVIPAAGLVLVFGLLFLPFLRRLRPESRKAFVLAGALYVGGALGMELPLGWWTERAGDHNLVYGLIDWVEETLELCGASLFLLAVEDHRRASQEIVS
jgi:hypothetical protein